MASKLVWRTGFGWDTVSLSIAAGAAAIVTDGAMRGLAAAVAVAAALYAAYRYRRWNGRGWRRVHFRAMLAYSEIAQRQKAAARQAARDFDVRQACSELGLLLVGENRNPVVDAMLADLARYEGTVLAALVERHAGEILPGAGFELRRELTARLRAVRLGPELVIAQVIENVYGGPEAARYAVAVAAGDAN